MSSQAQRSPRSWRDIGAELQSSANLQQWALKNTGDLWRLSCRRAQYISVTPSVISGLKQKQRGDAFILIPQANSTPQTEKRELFCSLLMLGAPVNMSALFWQYKLVQSDQKRSLWNWDYSINPREDRRKQSAAAFAAAWPQLGQ